MDVEEAGTPLPVGGEEGAGARGADAAPGVVGVPAPPSGIGVDPAGADPAVAMDPAPVPAPSETAGRAARGAGPRRRVFPGGGTTGYYLYGVARARGWRGGARRRGAHEADGLDRVRFRDLEALARTGPFDLPTLDRAGLAAHQRMVERAMRRGTILPAPPGVVFRGRRPLIRFLEDQYLALDEGLAFLDGHWELRVHAEPRAPGEPAPELVDATTRVYAELRRHARAAVPFPRRERRLLSAAFLVERAGWIDFIERAEDLATGHPELLLDVTGPWPPYDFVRMIL